MPLRTSSSGGGFRDTGLLSPEEYVAAGDFLVATCPTWSWAVRVVEGKGGAAPRKRVGAEGNAADSARGGEAPCARATPLPRAAPQQRDVQRCRRCRRQRAALWLWLSLSASARETAPRDPNNDAPLPLACAPRRRAVSGRAKRRTFPKTNNSSSRATCPVSSAPRRWRRLCLRPRLSSKARVVVPRSRTCGRASHSHLCVRPVAVTRGRRRHGRRR